MKLKMSPNSLFAILLRSPWWISLVIVAVFALASRALLPEAYVAYGVLGGFPFLVIGIMAAWRQWHTPSPASVAGILGRAGAMSWRDFSSAVEYAFDRQGYSVARLNSRSADFRLVKDGRISLVSCKRWKAASHGIDALRELALEKEAQGADQSIYISLGQVTDKARRFAQANGIHLMAGNDLAQLLSR